MNDLLPSILVVLVGGAFAIVQAQRFHPSEARLLVASFAAHIVSTFAQIAVTRIGGGDMFYYASQGEVLAAVLRADFLEFAPEIFKLIAHQQAMLPFEVLGMGTSTGSMQGYAAALVFLTGGGIHTLGFCVSIGSYFGQVAMYRAFREAFPAPFHRRLLFASLLVPSAVFWASGFVKEAVAMIGLGPVIFGLQRLTQRATGASLLGLIVGSALIVSVKAYVLIAVVGAAAAWMYFAVLRSPGGMRPVFVFLAGSLALVALVVLTRLFPTYSPDSFAEQVAYRQEIGQSIEGGSNYSLGAEMPTTFVGQLVFAPLAIFTALFRPLVIEARSPQVFVNALETLVVLVLTLKVLWPTKLARSWGIITSTPILAFYATFVLVLAVGVGFTTANMGTLSRYRMPLVPFLWAFVLVLDAPARQLLSDTSTVSARPRRKALVAAVRRVV